MAATAKHDLRRKFPTETATTNSGDEDIAAIAKQISDHAEAIYQTWKSRGLAPTEILNCHSNAKAVDEFGSALTPTSTSVMPGNPKKIVTSGRSSPTAAEILTQPPNLDNGNLEKLVNDFVVEDKARIAASVSRQRSPSKTLPSSIQFALQKFEKNSNQRQMSPSPKKPAQIAKPRIATKSPPGSHHREVFLETIETTFPPDLTPSKIIVQNQRRQPVSLDSNGTEENSSGIATWPFENKIGTKTPRRDVVSSSTSVTKSKDLEKERKPNSSTYLDEVAREEERLINALKTGSLITEEPQRQKPAIKKEKPKVEPVKPILLGHHVRQTDSASCKALTTQTQLHSPQIVANANTADLKTLNKEEAAAVSVADYVKIGYRAGDTSIRRSPGHEERRTSPISSHTNVDQLVSTARSNFESKTNLEAKPNFEPKTIFEAKTNFESKSKSETSDTETGNDIVSKDERDSVTSRWGPRINPSPRPRLEQVPHPELTTQQKQHIRAVAAAAAATGTGNNNPVRPFLTRGSVAERVLIFEKCPSELLLDKRGPRQPAIASWRTGHEVQNKAQTYAKEKSQSKNLPPHTTLQRHVKANRNVHIPRFYFPHGKPQSLSQVEATLSRITAAFQSLPGHRASRAQFHTITKACDLPLYWKVPLFLAAGGDQTGFVEMNVFLDFWKDLTNTYHDAASRFVRITTCGQRNHILPEDLIPLVQDVVETHPGLTFLKEATEFHSRYVHTVIARIYYCVNRSWSGKISVGELRRSNLLTVISVLEHEEDINQVTAYFSYEHFYVIYCKFWELDRDHDLFIDKMDLTRHNDHALSTRMIERIFSGAVGRDEQPEDKMSYTKFVWFLLSEEDKNHPTAIEYWFRCMDLDGDGYLSMYELEYFYDEQLLRMNAIGMETLPFEDCLCQMLDMIHPAIPGKISLSDLKRCKMTSIFFDTFFNLEKYLDHEHRDAFASARDHDADGHEMSDWDRFAAEEYELLVAEESGNEQNDQMLYDSASEDNTFWGNFENLGDESPDRSRNSEAKDNDHGENLTSPITTAKSVRSQHYDSGDSDDYADSDN